ncbi:23S rRNA (adenine(2030)-N(6))-methyltransferase RlmJ [Leadbettera azotonutricia]|nr:23S rRNA (adenine(2030)-N(6))-methyltransferase RlmJ [Leadbettera azotonutricia]
MLSYRHSFHAGNAADVLKHTILIFCLDYLGQKEKPLLCVDTHGGAGSYSFANREWEAGYGALAKAGAAEALPSMARRYLEIINAGGKDYPGSPLIMARLLRHLDRLVCFELHPEDFETLKNCLDNFRHVEVRKEDGPGSLKGLLPPPSRRGLILIDPAWEELSEYEMIPQILASALKRFPEGTYLVWYPLLLHPKAAAENADSETLRENLFAIHAGRRCFVELHTSSKDHAPANSPRGMYGSGLVIINPPYTLKPALEDALPVLVQAMNAEGGWKLEWKE